MAEQRIGRALVTGASAGLGEEFARQLAARGTSLVLVARRRERLEELADELSDRVEVEVLPADLGHEDGIATVETRLRRVDAAVDLLVNNAGFGLYGPFVEQDEARIRGLIDLNVGTLVRLTRVALPGMVARGGGAVVNIASTAAFQPDPYGAVYGATKSFVLSFSEAIREEVRGTGVRVLAVCPGATVTEFEEVAGVDFDRVPRLVVMDAERVVRVALRDLGRDRAVSIPGAANRVLAVGSSYSPRVLRRKGSGFFHRRVVH